MRGGCVTHHHLSLLQNVCCRSDHITQSHIHKITLLVKRKWLINRTASSIYEWVSTTNHQKRKETKGTRVGDSSGVSSSSLMHQACNTHARSSCFRTKCRCAARGFFIYTQFCCTPFKNKRVVSFTIDHWQVRSYFAGSWVITTCRIHRPGNQVRVLLSVEAVQQVLLEKSW